MVTTLKIHAFAGRYTPAVQPRILYATENGGKKAGRGEAASHRVSMPAAASGKDTLEITAAAAGSYTVYFADSAMVSRAVSRGVITVNGTDIVLSKNVKRRLFMADAEAQTKREEAYRQYISAHEAAVAQQQAAALAHAATEDAFDSSLAAYLLHSQKLQAYQQTQEGIDWSQMEWKTYGTELTVSPGAETEVGEIRVRKRVIGKSSEEL